MTQAQIVKELRKLQKLQNEKAELLGRLAHAVANDAPGRFKCELCLGFKHTRPYAVVRWGKVATYCDECKDAILSRSPFKTLAVGVAAVCIKQDELVSCDGCHSRAMKDGHLCLACGHDTTPFQTDRETEGQNQKGGI